MMLGFVLGPMVEENQRRTLQVSRGDPSVFVTRPISLRFIVAPVLILIVMAAPAVRKWIEEDLDPIQIAAVIIDQGELLEEYVVA